MEQREVVHQYYVIGATTLDKLSQILLHLSMEGIYKYKDSRSPLEGETQLYKLMSRSDPLTSQSLNEKVDLNKVKEALATQGIPFAFKKDGDKTTLFFRVKDKELAKNGLERMITDMKKNPSKILKKPNTMSFEEKVAYAKKQPQYQGTIKPTMQQSKGRGK